MRNHGCPREQELLDALQASRWPAACEEPLRAHVASCSSCSDLVSVVAPLLDEHRALMQEASVPSSGIVWWRSQMRFRREALERASQPISWIQGITIACAAGLLATMLGIFVPTFRRSLSWMIEAATSWSSLSVPVLENPLASPIVIAVLAAVGLCALVLPLALYFAFHED